MAVFIYQKNEFSNSSKVLTNMARLPIYTFLLFRQQKNAHIFQRGFLGSQY